MCAIPQYQGITSAFGKRRNDFSHESTDMPLRCCPAQIRRSTKPGFACSSPSSDKTFLASSENSNPDWRERNGSIKRILHTGSTRSTAFTDSRIEVMSCGPSIFLVMALSQSPAHTGSASSCSRTGTSIISKEYERYSLGMLSVNISFTGLANVLIAGMASISNRFNTAYYTTYRRVSGERHRLSAYALNRPRPPFGPAPAACPALGQ